MVEVDDGAKRESDSHSAYHGREAWEGSCPGRSATTPQ